MTNIIYVGSSDHREVAKADLAKTDFDGTFSKTTFDKGKVTEVDDAVGKALLESTIFASEFREATEDEVNAHEAGDDLGPSVAEGVGVKKQTASADEAAQENPSGDAGAGGDTTTTPTTARGRRGGSTPTP